MTRLLDRIIERLQLIDWTNQSELIIFRTKLINYGNMLCDELKDTPQEYRNYREIAIQHFMIKSMIKTLDVIIREINGN